LTAIGGLVACLSASPATAVDPGLYLGLGGGVNWLQDMDYDPGPAIDQDLGWAAIGSVGYRFDWGLRTELEAGYRDNDGEFNGTGFDTETTAWTGMANLLYDFGRDWPIRPYIGVGAGAANVNVDSNVTASNSEWAFAYQGIVGVSWAVTDRLDIFIDGRYLRTAGLDVDQAGLVGGDLDDEYETINGMVGLRYVFWSTATPVVEAAPEPAPAPAPVPEPAPPQNYIVFFDWDRHDLTPEAQEIIRQAAENARTGGYSRIQVTGHTDTSGSADYNLGLSQRRAQAVADMLIANGVPAEEIEVDWRGETEPLVPTGDGVREPQNRRATIDLQQAGS
jgi:outer membrane protein OmpA-like peptidoglycan-associated protein